MSGELWTSRVAAVVSIFISGFVASAVIPRVVRGVRSPNKPRRLVAPRARHSVPLRATWQQISLALGGRAGERLCRNLHRPSSRMTLLRLVHALPLPTPETPRVLGVDDWALRKGRSYGTILVAHVRHQVLDLLPDRTDGTLAAWLRPQHHRGSQQLDRPA
jgi:Transposase